MKYEISVHEISHDALVVELSHLVRYLCELGHERCKVCLGWHWGMDYYPDNNWESHFALVDLEAEVRKVEDSGTGLMGGDDLWVSVPPLDWEFCFCHHAGIHLTFTQPGPINEHFLERWRATGWSPTETEHADPA